MRQWLEYVAVRSVAMAIRPFPLSAVRRAGEIFGLLFYLADRVHRRIAIANLQVAFPKRSEKQCRAIAKAMFQHFGRLLLELQARGKGEADAFRRNSRRTCCLASRRFRRWSSRSNRRKARVSATTASSVNDPATCR